MLKISVYSKITILGSKNVYINELRLNSSIGLMSNELKTSVGLYLLYKDSIFRVLYFFYGYLMILNISYNEIVVCNWYKVIIWNATWHISFSGLPATGRSWANDLLCLLVNLSLDKSSNSYKCNSFNFRFIETYMYFT